MKKKIKLKVKVHYIILQLHYTINIDIWKKNMNNWMFVIPNNNLMKKTKYANEI